MLSEKKVARPFIQDKEKSHILTTDRSFLGDGDFRVREPREKHGESNLRGLSAGYIWDKSGLVHWSQDRLLMVEIKCGNSTWDHPGSTEPWNVLKATTLTSIHLWKLVSQICRVWTAFAANLLVDMESSMRIKAPVFFGDGCLSSGWFHMYEANVLWAHAWTLPS